MVEGRLQVRNRRLVRVMLKRLGEEITIMRPDGTEAVNQFGKKDDTDLTYSEVSRDEHAALYERDEQRLIAAGGRSEQHRPHIALAWNTDAIEGDRLDFPGGSSYHVENIVERGMFTRAQGVLDG